MKKLYISDLDGTLLLPGVKVGDKTKTVINNLISKGANITFCTARNYATSKDVLECFDLNIPVAFVNGALVYDLKTEKYIYKEFISEDSVKKILDIFQQRGQYPFMFKLIDEKLVFEYVSGNNEVGEKFVDLFKEQFGKNIRKLDCFNSFDNVVYFSTFGTYEFLKPIYEDLLKIKDICIEFYIDINTSMWLIEIQNAKCNKETASQFIKEYCKADYMIAFGDNDNDIPMIVSADRGVCVSNSTDNLKNKADIIIGSNIDESVCDYISKDFK